MNKLSIKSSIIAVLLAVLVPCIVYAAPPHDTQTDCTAKCHNTHKTLGSVGYNNICLSCHRYGSTDPRYDQIYPYVIADQAKLEGPSLGVLKPKSMQSSHNWEGIDNVPRVGAVPPLTPALLGPNPSDPNVANMFVGNLYCGRCHKVHGNNGYDTSISPPFLRITNDQDQMCLDCHSPRNKTSQASGTHPIQMNYSTLAKSKPYEYYYPPVNSNPANPTAEMKLNKVTGKVLCMTCHGIHHSDSNSRTFDNFSSVIFNRLSASQGYLLRTDLKGAKSSDRNICTNCHKTTDDPSIPQAERLLAKVKNHNGTQKQQNIQCADCHGGHVDEVQYDADAGNSNPNAFLLKRYVTYSSALSNGRNPKVIFQYTSVSNRNYNKNQFGVCLACHKTLPLTIEQHKATTSNTCEECHTHKAGFSANCTDCHGMPPRENTEGGPFGFARGYVTVVNEATSPHASHASGAEGVNNYYLFSCNECHKAIQDVPQHGNGIFQDIFNSKNGTKAGLLAGYDRPSRTCSNVYCHSNGLPSDRAAVYVPIAWGNNKDSIIGLQPQSARCAQCHEARPTTNAHQKHLTSGLLTGCVNCHANTVSDDTTLTPEARLTGGTHVNGYKDRRFSGDLNGRVLDGTDCSNIYCHSDGRGNKALIAPVWSDSSTGRCGACHFASTGSSVDPYAHFAHLSSVYGPFNSKAVPASCNYCHVDYPSTNHVNGSIELPANGTCSTNCHKNEFPNWKAQPQVRLACLTCHSGNLSVIDGKTASDKSALSSLGHGKSPISKTCTDCHDPNSQHFAISSGNVNRLIDNLINKNGAVSTECNFCHLNSSVVANPAYRNLSSHYTVLNGPADMPCARCHDIHGTTNKASLRTSLNIFNNTSTGWPIVYTNNTSISSFIQPNGRGLCQVCHTQTKFYRAGVTVLTHNSTTNCLNCHKHNNPNGAFAASGDGCNGCHGYPPVPKTAVQVTDRTDTRINNTNPSAQYYKLTYGVVGNYSGARTEDYIGGGGAHLNHVPNFARPSDGWSRCAPCHSAGNTVDPTTHTMNADLAKDVQTITLAFTPGLKFNNALQFIYSGARLSQITAGNPRSITGSCMNIACHYQRTPRWSNYSTWQP